MRIKSNLEPAELNRRLLERRCFFESAAALAAFRKFDLAKTIPSACEAVDVRRETYDVLYSLWPDGGPLAYV